MQVMEAVVQTEADQDSVGKSRRDAFRKDLNLLHDEPEFNILLQEVCHCFNIYLCDT